MSDESDAIKIGWSTADQVDLIFEEDKFVVMGLYGSESADYITELGFIVQDVECTFKVLQA